MRIVVPGILELVELRNDGWAEAFDETLLLRVVERLLSEHQHAVFGKGLLMACHNKQTARHDGGRYTSSHSLRTAALARRSAGVPSNMIAPWPMT